MEKGSKKEKLNINQGKEKAKLVINEWIKELEIEYLIKTFEKFFLFVSLGNGWYNNIEVDMKEIKK